MVPTGETRSIIAKDQMTSGSPKLRKYLKLLFLAGFYLCLILGGRWLEAVIEDSLQVSSLGQAGMPYIGAIAAILLLYIVLTAIPFVPGTEIGLALLMVFGAQVAGVVYLSTVSALTLAFALGRLVPERRLAAWLLRHGFDRTASLIETFSQLDPAERDHYLTQNAPRRLVPWLTRHRAITLIVLINLPGNTLLGGGGGIALVTGLSKLMPVKQFLVSVALAVAPVPAAILFMAWITP
jgi:hypothetical protein